MNRTKWLLVCFSLILGLVGCSAKTDRQVEKIIDKEHLTNEEKQLVKDSMLVEYVKDTYGNIVQITGFEIIPEEPEEAPPYITVKVKDREKGWVAKISCELYSTSKGKTTCKPYDNYLFRALSEGVQKEVEPALKKAFGAEKGNVNYFAFASVDNAQEKRWTFQQKPDYEKLKAEVPISIYIHSTAKESSIEDYSNQLFTFIQSLKKQEAILLDSNNGINFYKDEKLRDQYGNVYAKIITLDRADIKKIESPEQLKSHVRKGYMDGYNDEKERFERRMGNQ